MGRYLILPQLGPALRAGKSIEQWIGAEPRTDYTVLRWVRLDQARNGIDVAYYEVIDEGSPDFLDVYEFSAVDPDAPYGSINSFSRLEEALDFCEQQYGCSPARYVAGGMVQEEYADYLKASSPGSSAGRLLGGSR